MASTTDTALIVNIRKADLQWLTYAVRNVQTRNSEEHALQHALFFVLDAVLEKNPEMPSFTLTFAPDQAVFLLAATREGRCRTEDEQLTQRRLQTLFMANEWIGRKWK